MTFFQRKKPALNEVRDYASIRELLESAAKASGETVAVKYKTKKSLHDVTYNELLSKVNSLGTGLSGLTGERKRVAILLPKGFPFVLVFLTVLCSDGTVIPLDAELPFIENINILNHSDCDTLFFDKTFLAQIDEYRKALPKVKNYICVGLKEHEEDAQKRLFSYSALLERGQNALYDGDEEYLSLTPLPEETRMLLYKSGSTDSLFGVMLSQRALIAAVRSFLSMTALHGRCLSLQTFARPFEMICGLLSSFAAHTTVCLSTGLKSFQREIVEYRPDYMLLPPLYTENIAAKMLSDMETQGRADTFRTLVKTSNAMRKIGFDKRKTFFEKPLSVLGGKLATIYVSGAQLDPEAVEFFDNIGVQVVWCFGSAESGSVAVMNSEIDEEERGAGYLVPGLQCCVGEDENAGELLLSGEQLFDGYYKNDRATAEAFDGEGRYRTGLTGTVASKVTITGKIKNEIDLKIGRSVLPEEIESYLCALPFVREAHVFAGKDARGAEIHLCADIFLEKGEIMDLNDSERAAVVKEKIDRLNAGLPGYKRVRIVHIKK